MGRRESSHRAVQRCLALLLRLERGPATREELLAAVFALVGDEAYDGVQGSALTKRLDHDRRRLRDYFGIAVARRGEHYYLAERDMPLLDLPEDALRALVFLRQTFTPSHPMASDVHSLVQHLLNLLSPERRADFERLRLAYNVRWGYRDSDPIAPEVEEGLTKAITFQRLVAFDYLSPRQADATPRHHLAEPYERYFDAGRGHEYLLAYCLRTDGPKGVYEPKRFFHYRLGRIRNLQVLPNKFVRRSLPRYPLRYRLDASVARQGISKLPDITILHTEPQEDGSVIVEAETSDIWWAVRTLLHYGASCELLGGRRALAEMRRVVKDMALLYEE